MKIWLDDMCPAPEGFWTGWQKPGNFCLSVFTQ